MQFNKKIVLTALTISFHSAIICMEQAKLESKQHTDHISRYMTEENSEARKQNILPFTEWLTEKRNSFFVDKDWKTFCTNNHTLLKFTIGTLPMFKFPEMAGITAENLIDIIMNRAYKLQPDSSSQSLANIIDQDLLVLYHACFKSKKIDTADIH